MSAPFPYALVASPVGARIAWIQNERGVRNIWVADSADAPPRSVTPYREDDGQELSDLAFAADGGSIVYVRGGPPNREGEIPNPRSDARGAERAVWIVPATGGEPRRLADGGGAPSPAPAGKLVAFLRGGQVWSVPADGGGSPQPMFRARGRAMTLRWSPDGSRLALVSHRGDHAWIGVYDLRAGALRYLSPSVDVDGNPAWAPDGRRIAFTRIPQERRNVRFVLRRTGLPWSIVEADADTGKGQVVWEAAPGAGSVFAGLESENQLFWTAENRLVFPWERDGWLHLYSVPAAGGQATLLTAGEFEVEQASLSPDRRELIFSSNQGDIDRRHLWRVPATGGEPKAITAGAGIESSPVMTADGRAIACIRSDARRPAQVAIILGSPPPRPLVPLPEVFPLEDLAEPEPVVFSGTDGMRIHGQLFRPRGGQAGARLPAIVYVHGGSRRQMLLGWHPVETYHKAYALNQHLASLGFVVLSVNFRSGTGYGLEFREAEGFGARGGSELQDVIGAALYLRSRADVDPTRVGVWGGSYGGYLAAMALARSSELFKAGVSFNGVHDWNVELRIDDPGFQDAFRSSYDAETRLELERLARRSSPLGNLESWRAPVLLIHGDDDRSGPFRQTVELTHALRRRGVAVETLVLPDEEHTFLLHSSWLAAHRAAAEFFERRIRRCCG